jgi:hypothetical protein
MTALDIIGDIHGHADALERLLDALGYVLRDGVYRHPTHTVVFVGDFVDRGPRQRDLLRIVRAMMDRGSARAVMGNHELNAIAWATQDVRGAFRRPHTSKNRAQHREFLDQTEEGSDAYAKAVDWFKTLPLWLDLGGLRVVHACWHAASQQVLAGCLDDQACLTERGLQEILNNGSPAFRAAEVLLKGPEAQLPNGWSFHDKDGHLRHETRLRWWDPNATTFRTASSTTPIASSSPAKASAEPVANNLKRLDPNPRNGRKLS